MNILDFLKEKPIKEKEDFLNSLKSMKIDYNKTEIIPLDYNKNNKGL